jgi:tetratricopeptide (TPR) repeat protein
VDPDAATLDRIEALLRARNPSGAERVARDLTVRTDSLESHVLLGRALQQQGQWQAALLSARAARQRDPTHPAAALLYAECLLQGVERERGIEELKKLEQATGAEPRVLQDIGRLYSHLNLHVDAERCYARAVQIDPHSAQTLYNWSTCLIALGRLDEAEAALDRVIEMTPDDFDAYYNRATLRSQRPDRNHVAQIERALSQTVLPPHGRVALGYALAKELEDLGRYSESFSALSVAATTRRHHLSYSVQDDLRTMQEIARGFDQEYQRKTDGRGYDDGRPIFIVGLPRSDTTLVDRILSSHPEVESRGESSDLATCMVRLAGAAPDKQTLIKLAAGIDPKQLGLDFCAGLPGVKRRVIDKTPINFLYLGLIAAALPSATIIHVRRHPVDVCYAMYKTLFRMAYPFSYDLQDLAGYYQAYATLMQHWREMLGERLVEIDYEQLVEAQEPSTRELLAASKLSWDPRCLQFHNNDSPSLTASAAQVRQPLYRSSVGLWRRYEQELSPLIATLRAAGVTIA